MVPCRDLGDKSNIKNVDNPRKSVALKQYALPPRGFCFLIHVWWPLAVRSIAQNDRHRYP